jgi:hypothetical protein
MSQYVVAGHPLWPATLTFFNINFFIILFLFIF